jgi:ribosomal protein L37AE/L43A
MTEQPADQTALRDRIAAAIWERQNPGRRWADCEYRWRADAEADADSVLAVLPEPADDAAGVAEAIRSFPFDNFGMDDVSFALEDDPEAQEWVPALADAVLAVLPAPADRAAILREAADALDADMERFFGEWPDEPRNSPYALGRKDAATELRRMADEAQQPTGCDHDSQVIDHEGHQYWACLKCGQNLGKVAVEVQQPETQADAHPPTVTWEIESPRRGTWASWGTTYDEHDWARERFQDAIGHVPARQFRLVRATTVYVVEAEHAPAAVSQPGKEATQ